MSRTPFIAFGVLALAAGLAAADAPNTLSNREKAEGWKLLFDGTTTTGWRGYQKETVPEGWTVADGNQLSIANGAWPLGDGTPPAPLATGTGAGSGSLPARS